MNIYIKMYLNKNLGDDLMLYKFAEYFNRYSIYIDCQTIFIDYYRRLLKDFSNVEFVRCPLREIEKKYGKGFFGCVVLLGGSVLQGNKYSGCWYRFLNCLFLDRYKKHGTQYAIIGCNTGPFKNRFTEYFVKLEVKRASVITTRDKDSLKFIYNVKKTKSDNIYYFPDILFGLQNNYNVSDKNKENTLGIAVHGPSNDKTIDFLSQVCNEFLLKPDSKVILFAFETGINNNDEISINALIKLIENKKNVKVVYNSENIFETVDVFAECSRIIAVRFHAAVLASVICVPFVTISYSNKMKNFMNDIGQSQKDFSVNELNKIKVNEFLQTVMDNPVIPDESYQKKHECHFETLMNFINKQKWRN